MDQTCGRALQGYEDAGEGVTSESFLAKLGGHESQNCHSLFDRNRRRGQSHRDETKLGASSAEASSTLRTSNLMDESYPWSASLFTFSKRQLASSFPRQNPADRTGHRSTSRRVIEEPIIRVLIRVGGFESGQGCAITLAPDPSTSLS